MQTELENPGVSKWAASFGMALVLASLVNAALVVAKEKSPAMISFLQRLAGHHWISHAAIVLMVFVGSGWLLSLGNQGRGPRIPAHRLPGIIVGGVAIAAAIIIGFYLTEI